MVKNDNNLIGISRSSQVGDMCAPLCDIIYNYLKKKNEFEEISIDIENFDKYKKYNFDILITFSSYHSDPAVCPLEQIKWEKRIKTKMLNYKNILYLESPICEDLIPGRFRLSLNSIYFCKSKLEDHVSHKKFEYMRNNKKNNLFKDIPKNRKHILVLVQNPHQYFINKDLDEYELYLINIIKKIREKTKNKIIIRYKPKHMNPNRKPYDFNIDIAKYNCEISDKSLEEDCRRCYKCVAHSTNAVSFCIFMGLDIIGLSKYNLAYGVCEKNFENVDKYLNYNYTDLKKKILASGWNGEYLLSEKFIRLLKNIIKKS